MSYVMKIGKHELGGIADGLLEDAKEFVRVMNSRIRFCTERRDEYAIEEGHDEYKFSPQIRNQNVVVYVTYDRDGNREKVSTNILDKFAFPAPRPHYSFYNGRKSLSFDIPLNDAESDAEFAARLAESIDRMEARLNAA